VGGRSGRELAIENGEHLEGGQEGWEAGKGTAGASGTGRVYGVKKRNSISLVMTAEFQDA